MTTEREMIDSAQECIAGLKLALREIQKINKAAGRNAAANAAMKHRGQAIVLHAEMTESLIEFYPELSDDVQARGPGGR